MENGFRQSPAYNKNSYAQGGPYIVSKRNSGRAAVLSALNIFRNLKELVIFMKASIDLKLSSKILSILAFLTWICSTLLIGFALYSGEERIPGYLLLFMGWLSPLALNFAWLANIFFLYGFSRLVIGKPAVKSSVLAVFFSFDTFRLSEFPTGPGSTAIYGYGWGVVLWFLSLFLLLSAAGTQQYETTHIPTDRNDTDLGWLRFAGFALCGIALGLSVYWSIRDRKLANADEQHRLIGLAFKRGSVCGDTVPSVQNPIRNFSGPLEIVFDINIVYGAYPFTKIKTLLDWGVPVVRMGNTDYSFETTPDGAILTSVPASAKPTAILYVEENTNSEDIHAKLVDANSGRTVFDQIWKRENLPVNNDFYCPDYHSFPNENEHPRKLLVQALSLPQKSNSESDNIKQRDPLENKVEGTVIRLSEDGDRQSNTTAQKDINRHRRNSNAPRQQPAATALAEPIYNINCREDVGWDPVNRDPADIGWPFYVGNKAYYPGRRDRNKYNAICVDDHAYLYYYFESDGEFKIVLEKRMLSNFNQTWTGVVLIKNALKSNRYNDLKILSVKETDGNLFMTIRNEGTGQTALLRASLIVIN